ncbi:hypothetical protein SLS56_000154 [Neofusicoccum ribis]|uniref:Uncharacterized protein n=1 Tax=Neofusicoccum ribis TaxID=45134 RepID=A0ABR3TFL3_9PEZI
MRRRTYLVEENRIEEAEEKKCTRQVGYARRYQGRAEVVQRDGPGTTQIYEKKVSVDVEEKFDSYYEVSEKTEGEHAVPPPPYTEHKLHRRTYFSMIKESDEERELSKATLAKQEEAAAKWEEKRLMKEALRKAEKKLRKQGSICSSNSNGC